MRKWKEPVGRLEFPQLPPCPGQGLKSVVPNPEVPEKARRRSYTAEYKRLILREAQACKEQSQVGALLRREGLYASNLTAWRHQVERGTLDALSSKKRGPKSRKPDPSVCRIAEQEKEIQKPLAIVILGGLISSTVLNMMVLPSLYLKFGKEKQE